ncbi:MAG TPA: YHS domain-containing protein [Sandaracinaceae bacterium]
MKHIVHALAFAAIIVAGCGGSSEPEAEPAPATETTAGSEAPLVPPGEAQVGDRTTCPVSGEEFVVSESSPSVEHEGRTYYFCCPGCAERFQANPEQYLGGGENAG